MIQAIGGHGWTVPGFGEDERALNHSLCVKRQARGAPLAVPFTMGGARAQGLRDVRFQYGGTNAAVRETTEPSNPIQLYRVYIKAAPQAIWDAITQPEWTVKYGYAPLVDYDLQAGGRFRAYPNQGMKQFPNIPDVIIDGEVMEAIPPRRLVQTWRMLMEPGLAAEGFTRLTYELEPVKGGVTKLTVTHDVTGAPTLGKLFAGVWESKGAGGGWPEVLSGLKTLLETGAQLPFQSGPEKNQSYPDPASKDETDIRGLLDSVRKAHHDKDAAALIAPYVDGAVIYDLAPPLSHPGMDLETKQTWLDTWDGPIEIEAKDFRFTIRGDAAFGHGFYRMSGIPKAAGRPVSFWMRATVCLHRDKGVWQVVHEHTSVPFYMDGSLRPAFDLEP